MRRKKDDDGKAYIHNKIRDDGDNGKRRSGGKLLLWKCGGRANRKLVSTTCATNRCFRNLRGTRWRQQRDHTYPRQKHHYDAAAKLFRLYILQYYTRDVPPSEPMHSRFSHSHARVRNTRVKYNSI